MQYENPFDVGMTGLLGYGVCYEALHQADLVLLLGTDFPYDDFLPTTNNIQVDIDPARLGRRAPVAQGVAADMGETLRALLPLLPQRTNRTFLDDMLKSHERKLSHSVETYNVHHPTIGPSIPNTSPPSSTNMPGRTPSSPRTPVCAAPGSPATSPRTGSGGSSDRSTTARWPTLCRWPLAPRYLIRDARSSRFVVMGAWPCCSVSCSP